MQFYDIFHLQMLTCLWRKIQDIGLINLYRTDEEIRKHIQMCATLAYLPLTDVDEGWLSIQEMTPINL